MTRALLRDNDDTTIMPVPRHWASHPDCRCLPILIGALQAQLQSNAGGVPNINDLPRRLTDFLILDYLGTRIVH